MTIRRKVIPLQEGSMRTRAGLALFFTGAWLALSIFARKIPIARDQWFTDYRPRIWKERLLVVCN
jgi:hypothetical protein